MTSKPETIEAWIVVTQFKGNLLYYVEEDAKKVAQEKGGTVVRLTGSIAACKKCHDGNGWEARG
jgi:hypothetical protein